MGIDSVRYIPGGSRGLSKVWWYEMWIRKNRGDDAFHIIELIHQPVVQETQVRLFDNVFLQTLLYRIRCFEDFVDFL